MFSASKSASVSNAYALTKSLRFRSSASAYLSRTPSSAGNRKTFTVSYWVKRGTLGVAQYLFSAGSGTTESTWFTVGTFDNNGTSYDSTTLSTWTSSGGQSVAVYRDPSAWYHFVWAVDTTQATASNRVKLWVNNVQQTLSTISITQNADLAWNNSGVVHYIGARIDAGPRQFFDGYLTEIYNIDGQALTPSSFGATDATTGQWVPAKYTGTYGTNGFYLPFTNTTSTTTLGYDSSGNSNNWTTNNFSLTAGSTYDSMNDVPTLTSATVANYCVLNPLATGSGKVLVNGNLEFTSNTTGWYFTSGTIGFSSGKYYWEVNIGSSAGSDIFAGIMGSGMPTGTAANGLQDNVSLLNTYGSLLFCDDGKYQLDGNTSRVAYSTYLTANQTLGIAVDMGAKSLTFYKDGVSQGAISFSSSPMANSNVCPVFSSYYSTDSNRVFNFGQRAFAYTPPSGYLALNTYNLSAPTIAQGNKYMDATLYTGNSGVNVITGIGFQPDMLWQKDRTSTGNNVIDDAVRGINNVLITNSTGAELTGTTYLTSFDSNGFSMNTASPAFNFTGRSYVAWSWKANGSGSSNTAGSITSTVSASTTSGFSIVTYTGTGANATIGHGLGVAPSMIIIKCRNAAGDIWPVYHVSIGNTQYLRLNASNGAGTYNEWQNTTPTSSVFYISTDTVLNTNGNTYVAYCFAPIAGYSAFGSYVGNGSTDGVFIYNGFRPRYVMIKNTSAIEDWLIYDTARNTSNLTNLLLYADLNSAEVTASSGVIDILSNGFKLRGSASSINTSGATYIYMAFAENPFKYANAR
jgi:hypothetical protein